MVTCRCCTHCKWWLETGKASCLVRLWNSQGQEGLILCVDVDVDLWACAMFWVQIVNLRWSCIMLLWKESFKGRDRTLIFNVRGSGIVKLILHTWRRSSKSQPASFFILEVLLLNLRIIPPPNVRAQWYLVNCKSDKLILLKVIEITYCLFNAWMETPPAAYKTRIKWVNTAFQTPRSNSCKGSGTKSQ